MRTNNSTTHSYYMNAKQILTAVGLSLAVTAMAAPLTPEQALQRARSNGPARIAAKMKGDVKPVFTAVSPEGVTGAYVFNLADGGYSILSADDVALPVLAYSDKGFIDASDMSPEMKWWLSEYAREIEWASKKGIKSEGQKRVVDASWSAISPLIATRWGQDAPYNNDCPKINDKITYTGCVATSMAQVMNYHKYPEKGVGIKQYSWSSQGRRLTINFSQKEFDWNSMLNSYLPGKYTEEQAAAVSYLMKACGYSVEMNYGLSASGAQGSSIAPALKEYFNYDEGCRSVQRIIYSPTQWEAMFYENLRDCGPIVVNGQSPLQGGHSFICDGYDGKGFFHFNWGWNGMSDGYYSLSALNPDAQGIGGATGGFNFSQNAILGIQPPTGKPYEQEPDRVLQYGTLNASISGKTINLGVSDYNPLGWSNATDHRITCYIGAIIEPIDGTPGETMSKNGTMNGVAKLTAENYNAYFPAERTTFIVELPDLPDGKYKVYSASCPVEGENPQWTPMATPWGMINYCILTVSGGQYSVENVKADRIVFSDVKTLSPLYAGKNVLFSAQMANHSNIELSQGLSPVLCDASGKETFMGESIIVDLSAGETIEKQWVSRFYNKNGLLATVQKETNFTLKFKDPQTNLYAEGIEIPVVLLPNPGAATVMLTGYSMDCDSRQDYLDFRNVAIIDNLKDHITGKLTFKVTKGFYDGIVTFSLSMADGDSTTEQIVLNDDMYHDYAFVARNETKEINFDLYYPDFKLGHVYYLNATYTLGSRVNDFGGLKFFFGDPLGVDEISTDANSEAEYYSLQGIRLSEPTDGQLVIERRAGKTVKKVFRK